MKGMGTAPPAYFSSAPATPFALLAFTQMVLGCRTDMESLDMAISRLVSSAGVCYLVCIQVWKKPHLV